MWSFRACEGPGHWGGRDGARRGALPMIGEGIEALELVIDGLGEGKWIEAIPQGGQGRNRGGIAARGRLHSLEGRAGGVVAPAEARADALLAHELDRGQEQGLEQAQLVAGKKVCSGQGGRGGGLGVAPEVAGGGPIFL